MHGICFGQAYKNFLTNEGYNRIILDISDNGLKESEKYLLKSIKDGKIQLNQIYNISDEKEYTFKDMLDINKVSKFKILIPKSAIKILHGINKVSIKKQFIEENSIKLVSDNIYSSNKINKNINMKYNLSDLR